MGVADRFELLSPAVWKSQACEHDGRDLQHVQDIVTHELTHVFHGQHNPTRDFTGMDGEARTNQGMLGVAWIGNGESLFVKLVGAKDVVHAERANFVAFVQSLREDG